MRGIGSRGMSFGAIGLGMCGRQESKRRANRRRVAKPLTRQYSVSTGLMLEAWSRATLAWQRQNLPGRGIYSKCENQHW